MEKHLPDPVGKTESRFKTAVRMGSVRCRSARALIQRGRRSNECLLRPLRISSLCALPHSLWIAPLKLVILCFGNLTANLFDFAGRIQYNICSEHGFRARQAGHPGRGALKK